MSFNIHLMKCPHGPIDTPFTTIYINQDSDRVCIMPFIYNSLKLLNSAPPPTHTFFKRLIMYWKTAGHLYLELLDLAGGTASLCSYFSHSFVICILCKLVVRSRNLIRFGFSFLEIVTHH
jgi:hypothetical protein